MGWQDSIIPALRVIINDDGGVAAYSDDRLEMVSVLAAQFVNQEITDLENDYIISLVDVTISPDFTSSTYKDDIFLNLILMRAACFIDQSTLRTKAAASGIIARLGPASLDTAGNLAGFVKLLEMGPCATYAQLKNEVLFSNTNVCHAIMSAFVNNKFDPDLVRSRVDTRRDIFQGIY